MPDDKVSISEFARRVGVAYQVIQKAIKSGRIDAAADGKINYTTEVVKWFQNRDISKAREHNAPDDDPAVPSLSKAKLAKETFTAKLRQLEFERESGKLIPRDEVKISIFRFCSVVRDSVLTIPDRVAAQQAADLVAYLKESLKKKLGKEICEQVIELIDAQDVERITHRAWDKESRAVLEQLDEGPKV